MPQFILDSAGTVDLPPAPVAFDHLDEFTRGYIEALFFTEEAPGVDSEEFETPEYQAADGSIPGDVGFSELAPDALAKIMRDCAAFQAAAAPLLALAYERDYSEEQAGRDFWLTRNGHGAGFWDRDALAADDLGRQLSDLCGWRTPFAEVAIYFHAGTVRLI